jgi:hypothetical protein
VYVLAGNANENLSGAHTSGFLKQLCILSRVVGARTKLILFAAAGYAMQIIKSSASVLSAQENEKSANG